MIYIHIDLGLIVIFCYNLNWLFSQNHLIRFVNTSDSSHFFHVDKKQLFNGIIGWCISYISVVIRRGGGPRAGVKLPAWKVGDQGFEPHTGL